MDFQISGIFEKMVGFLENDQIFGKMFDFEKNLLKSKGKPPLSKLMNEWGRGSGYANPGNASIFTYSVCV